MIRTNGTNETKNISQQSTHLLRRCFMVEIGLSLATKAVQMLHRKQFPSSSKSCSIITVSPQQPSSSFHQTFPSTFLRNLPDSVLFRLFFVCCCIFFFAYFLCWMLIGCPMLISARRFKNTAGFFFIGLDLIGFNRWRICIVRIQRRRRDWIQPETKESGRFGKKSKFQNRLHVSSVAPIAFVFNQIISLL